LDFHYNFILYIDLQTILTIQLLHSTSMTLLLAHMAN